MFQSKKTIPRKDSKFSKMTKSKTKWAYLAGIFDGEGCIHIATIHPDKQDRIAYRLDVNIVNTDKRLVDWIVENFGGTIVNYKAPVNKNWKDYYHWHPRGLEHKEKIFLGMLPYLVIKHDRVKIGLEFTRLGRFTNNRPARADMCARLRVLTKRGKSVTTNTPGTEENSVKIESELIGDNESDLAVMQAS